MKHPASQASAVLEKRFRDTFTVFVVLAHQSAQYGSEITAAPGQPVDKGALRGSIQREIDDIAARARIGSPLEYAPGIERGVGPHGPLTLRSAVGGFHSFSKTVAATDRLLVAASRAVENSNG